LLALNSQLHEEFYNLTKIVKKPKYKFGVVDREKKAKIN